MHGKIMPPKEVISTINEINTVRGLALLQDYFVYLEQCLNKEPSTQLSFLRVCTTDWIFFSRAYI
jgi:hypothetical protein